MVSQANRSRIGVSQRWGVQLHVAALFAVVLSSAVAFAQEPVSITGQVVDVATGDPIAGVEVVLASREDALQPSLLLHTDDQGEFSVASIQAGMYRLELSHPLYNPSVGDFNVMR